MSRILVFFIERMKISTPKQTTLKEFQVIPGVGKRVAEDLWSLGFRSVRELRGNNPEKMYKNLCMLQGQHIDRCMLYVFRCAVYYASHTQHNPQMLLWWNWTDDKMRTYT